MRALSLPAAFGLVAISLLPSSLMAQDKPAFQTGMIPGDHILLPDGEPTSAVFLISDAAGWGADDDAQAQALVDKGAAVVGIDFPSYLKALRADQGDCVYMISDIEDLSHQVQRTGGATSYSLPVLTGIGEGGALALAMISQSPAATIGQAIAVDPVAGIPLAKQLCTPAKKTPAGDRIVYGFTDGPLPAPVTVLFTDKAPQDGRDHVTALQTAHPDVETSDEDGTAKDVLAKALSDQLDAAGNTDDPLGLPLNVLATKPTMDTMAVVYSGDGGWRDIDSQVAGALHDQGIPVVGVDSMRYFWTEKKPQETTNDLVRIIDTYRREWNVRHVLLVGYSFGADILPATYNLLPDAEKQRVPQVTLMALSHQVDYVISVTGWLGVAGEGKGGDPVNDIAKIKPSLVQCIYGTDEEDDACPTLKDKGIDVVAIDGGHHFDGDYKAIGQKIVDALKTRLAQK